MYGADYSDDDLHAIDLPTHYMETQVKNLRRGDRIVMFNGFKTIRMIHVDPADADTGMRTVTYADGSFKVMYDEDYVEIASPPLFATAELPAQWFRSRDARIRRKLDKRKEAEEKFVSASHTEDFHYRAKAIAWEARRAAGLDE